MAARASARRPPRGVSARRPFRLSRTTRRGATAPPAGGVRWTAARTSPSTPTCLGGPWSRVSGTPTAVDATRPRTRTSARYPRPVLGGGRPSQRAAGGGAARQGGVGRRRSAARPTRTTLGSGPSTVRRSRGTRAVVAPTAGRTSRSPARSRNAVLVVRPQAVRRWSGQVAIWNPPRASPRPSRRCGVPPGAAVVRPRSPGRVRRLTRGCGGPTGWLSPSRRTRPLWIRGTPRACTRGRRRPART